MLGMLFMIITAVRVKSQYIRFAIAVLNWIRFKNLKTIVEVPTVWFIG